MHQIAEKSIIILMLLVCSIQDIRTKKVSIWLIGSGVILLIIQMHFSRSLTLPERLGGTLVGVIVLLLSKVTGGKIGIGDGLILCATGISLGFWQNLEMFFYGLVLAAFVSILLLSLRLADRKKSLPFIPFLFVGYLGILVLERYG